MTVLRHIFQWVLLICTLLICNVSFANSKCTQSLNEKDVARRYFGLKVKYRQTKYSLDPHEFEALQSKILTNPVAALKALTHYDPTKAIGFCFGRAMAVELLARKMGLYDSSIKKIFIVGDLRSSDKPEWRFHVATLLRGWDGQFYAIDLMLAPFLPQLTGGKVPTEAQWIKIIRQIWDKNHLAKLYKTPAGIMIPNIRTMIPLDQETGERIMELSFKPSTNNGFSLEPGSNEVYLPNPRMLVQHFIGMNVPISNPFRMDKVVINGKDYGYNSYFFDLISFFDRKEPLSIGSTYANTVPIPGLEITQIPPPIGHGGMLFHKIINRKSRR